LSSPSLTSAAQPFATIGGRITLIDSGDPAAEVAIICTPREGANERRAQTDADGRYALTVPPGVYRLRAQVVATEPRYLSQEIGADDPMSRGQAYRVRAGDRVQADWALRLAGSISGRVVDPDGVPLRDSIVTVEQELDDDESVPFATSSSTIAVGETARFSIGGLTPGTYRVGVEPPQAGGKPDPDGRILIPTFYPGVADRRSVLPLRLGDGSGIAGP
jgi:hypothetical protein